MKKISLVVKEFSENKIKSDLKNANTVFIIKYSGLSSPEITSLRQSLNQKNASLFVVRNNVARRSLKEAGFEGLTKYIEQPCGLVFVKDEPVAIFKVLVDFVKDHEKMKLEAGLLQDKLLEKAEIIAMSKLPSKEIMRAMLVMTLNSPIQGLVTVLSQTTKKFLYCLEQIKQKKTSGAAPAETK